MPILFGLYFIGGVIPPIFFSDSGSVAPLTATNCYHYLCHQQPERSLYYEGRQLNFCARCTGLYGSIFLATLILSTARPAREFSWLWLIPFSVPMLLDVIFSISAGLPFPNLTRLLIGVITGLGGTLVIYSRYLSLVERYSLARPDRSR